MFDMNLEAVDIIYTLRLHGSLVDSVLECQSRGSGFKTRPGQKFDSMILISVQPAPASQLSYDEHTNRTLSVKR